jgi:hypothetical protein
MRIRRLTIAGVALVAAVGLAGCGASADKAEGRAEGRAESTAEGAAVAPAGVPATTAQADAAAELAGAAAKLAGESMHVRITMAGGVTMTGVADARAQTADMSMTLGAGLADKLRIIRVGSDMWARGDGSIGALVGGSDKWVHLDISRMSNLIGSGEPATAAKMLRSAADVRSAGDHRITGTVDLTEAETSSAAPSMGENAKAVPFTARTDDQGRLIELTIDMSGVASGAGRVTSTYSDFGTPVSVKVPPKSKTVEAPARLPGPITR